MPLDVQQTGQYLKRFDFKRLFINELGWDIYETPLEVVVDQATYRLQAVAEKRGFVAYVCPPPLPDYARRSQIELQVARSVREHLIIFVDEARTIQIWQWVRREPGKPLARREHHYHADQSGQALSQKLEAIAFSFIQEEKGLYLTDVTGGARAAFDVERVTRRFYDLFKKERDAFHQFLSGIPETGAQRWYVSIMLNRLMFIYFIQKKGFLDGDPHYLQHKLAESQRR
ncbi:MAG TPA: SAM-dependent methyltransferase, partial [Anaerolineae bacterium]